MKEKTFEELIDENTNWTKATLGGYEKTISIKKCLKLMHQVREATIAECRESIRKEHKTYTPFEGRHYQLPLGEQLYNLNKLPTDRIKITENK